MKREEWWRETKRFLYVLLVGKI